MRKRTIAALLLLLIVLGAGTRALPVRTGYHYWDETVYLQHGKILAGDRAADTYNEFDFRPPLIGLLAGAVFAFSGGTSALHILLSLLAAASIPLTYLLGWEMWNPRVGLLAAAGVLLSAEHFVRSHFILVDAFLPSLWLVTALLTLYLYRAGRPGYAVLLGAASGVTVLTKFTSLVLPAAAGLTLLLARSEGYSWSGMRMAARETVLSRNTWLLVGGFAAVLLPYFAWSHAAYGSPLHTFQTALEVADASRPLLTYVKGAGLLLPLPFLLGIPLFLTYLRKPDMNWVLPAVFTLSLAVPVHIWPNRSLRFLLPVVPFAAVASAAGFETVRERAPSLYPAAVAVLLVLSLPTVLSHPYALTLMDGETEFVDSAPPTHDAALWLERETPENTTVYANDRWAELAYYSGRRVRVVPVDDTGVAMRSTSLAPGGNVVYYPDSTYWGGPNLTVLQSSPRYEHLRSFDAGRIQVFRVLSGG